MSWGLWGFSFLAINITASGMDLVNRLEYSFSSLLSGLTWNTKACTFISGWGWIPLVAFDFLLALPILGIGSAQEVDVHMLVVGEAGERQSGEQDETAHWGPLCALECAQIWSVLQKEWLFHLIPLEDASDVAFPWICAVSTQHKLLCFLVPFPLVSWPMLQDDTPESLCELPFLLQQWKWLLNNKHERKF